MPLLAPGVGAPTPVPPTPPPGSGTGGGGTEGPGGAPDGAWGELGVSWTGWDGSEWVLSSPTSPVWLTPAGTRGLNMPPTSRFTSQAPALAGSRWRGYRVEERPVFWPLFIYGDSTAQWRAADRAWWATMRPDAPGTWTVTQPDGTRRRLRCRYDGDNDQVFGRDPFSVGWVLYGVDLVAEDPFWRGDPVRRSFSAAPAEAFYGGAGGTGFAPPYVISANTSTATATMPNDGDEPAWPVWTVNGPFTSASVGVAGRTIAVPFSLASGKSLRIDTRPDRLSAVDSDGNDRVDDLGAVSFAPVPPGVEVPVTITVPGSTSATTVAVEIEPLYYRAW